MRRPWMPLWVAHYLADTAHLNAEQSGAYLHLIMHYWLHDHLPDEDHQLAVIAKVTYRKWCNIRNILAPFFGPGWSSQKRLDLEIKEADERIERASEKARNAANKRWKKHCSENAPSIARSNQQAMPVDAHLHTHTQRKERGPAEQSKANGPSPPAPVPAGRGKAFQYWARVEDQVQKLRALGNGEPVLPAIDPTSPEWPAWEAYFDHLGFEPSGMRHVRNGTAPSFTVPAKLPQEFDESYSPAKPAGGNNAGS